MVERVPVEDVLARRMRAHGLSERVSVDRLAEVVGACGVQDSPPGAALLALHARVEGLTPEHLDRAITEDKVVLRAWAMRGAPFLVPTVDAAVFTTGVLPPTESGREHLVVGVREALRSLGMGMDEAVAATRAEIVAVLSGRCLPIGALGAEVAARIAPTLAPRQRERWQAEGPYAKDQPLGQAVVHFCLRILTLEQEGVLLGAGGHLVPLRPARRVGRPGRPAAAPESGASGARPPVPAVPRPVHPPRLRRVAGGACR